MNDALCSSPLTKVEHLNEVVRPDGRAGRYILVPAVPSDATVFRHYGVKPKDSLSVIYAKIQLEGFNKHCWKWRPKEDDEEG